MCRHIKLRHDIDSHCPAVFDKLAELIFCIIHIFRCRRFIFAVQYAGFQPEPGIRLFQRKLQTCLHIAACHRLIIFHKNQVVAEMHLETVHFIPGHILCKLINRIQAKRLPSHIKAKCPDLILRIIPCLSFWNTAACLLKNLQDTDCPPVGACRLCRFNNCRITDRKTVAFFSKPHIRRTKSQEKVPHFYIIARTGNYANIQTGNLLIIFRKCISYVFQFAASYNNPAEYRSNKITACRAMPFLKLRNHIGLRIRI